MSADPSLRIRKAILDPASAYASPAELAADPALNAVEKAALLAAWEADARELMVAEEENMAGGEPSRLEEILAARAKVDPEAEPRGQHKQASASVDFSRFRVRHFLRPVGAVAEPEQSCAATRRQLDQSPLVPVCDDGRVIGIIGEAELALWQDAEAATGDEPLTARDVMQADLASCSIDDSLAQARTILNGKQRDALLVREADGRLAGILARADQPTLLAPAVNQL